MSEEKRVLFLFLIYFCPRIFMAAAPTKNQKIEALVKLVQKRSRGAGLTAPPQRTVLETLMYAALLENAAFDKADIAYTVLENSYIDWNEIRVCSVRELADTLTDLPNPEAAADRIRKALQGIFEKLYVFDLEDTRKKGKALAEHIKFLEDMSAGTPYMIQYVAQVALDGHLFPLDEASLRIMRRLGLSHVSNDGTQELCLGLDRVVLKKNGLTFAAQLHHFAAGYYEVPDDPELLSLLSKIDPEAVNRSWVSPILTPQPSPTQPLAPSPSVVIPEPEPKAESSKAIPIGKPKVSAKAAPVAKPKPSKPVPKPLAKKVPAKPAKKPMKKPVSGKSAVKVPRKPVKPVSLKKKVKAAVKKVPAKLVKKLPVKKTTVKKSPVKKAMIKKSPVKKATVKKLKGVSPSKALRQRKPK